MQASKLIHLVAYVINISVCLEIKPTPTASPTPAPGPAAYRDPLPRHRIVTTFGCRFPLLRSLHTIIANIQERRDHHKRARDSTNCRTVKCQYTKRHVNQSPHNSLVKMKIINHLTPQLFTLKRRVRDMNWGGGLFEFTPRVRLQGRALDSNPFAS